MEIEFDPTKDEANIAKHGMSLAEAVSLDLLVAAVVVDDRFDYGETRYRAFGRVDGEPRAFTFTYRNGKVRGISYRRAHEKEMRSHGI